MSHTAQPKQSLIMMNVWSLAKIYIRNLLINESGGFTVTMLGRKFLCTVQSLLWPVVPKNTMRMNNWWHQIIPRPNFKLKAFKFSMFCLMKQLVFWSILLLALPLQILMEVKWHTPIVLCFLHSIGIAEKSYVTCEGMFNLKSSWGKAVFSFYSICVLTFAFLQIIFA